MNSINLYWFKLPDGSTNYGDELNYYIIRELTGFKIDYIRFPYRWYKVILLYVYNRVKCRINPDFKGMIRSIFAKNILVAIGSVLHVYDRKGVIVWGSGIINEGGVIKDASFKAVRGYETLKVIGELGYDTNIPVGDPALLLPLMLPPSPKKKKLGVIPHFRHYQELSKTSFFTTNYVLINLKDDVKSITEQISSCEYVVSSSLHGIIVAQSYNIPALWVNFCTNIKIYGDDIKFKDYFSSVNIKPYRPILLESYDLDYINDLFNKNIDKTQINVDLTLLQDKLLKAFPYTLKEKYIRK